MRSFSFAAPALLLLLGVASGLPALPAHAGDVYASATLAISTGEGSAGGATPFFANGGSDTDSSPAYGLAAGFAIPYEKIRPKGLSGNCPRSFGAGRPCDAAAEYFAKASVAPGHVVVAQGQTEYAALAVLPGPGDLIHRVFVVGSQ